MLFRERDNGMLSILWRWRLLDCGTAYRPCIYIFPVRLESDINRYVQQHSVRYDLHQLALQWQWKWFVHVYPHWFIWMAVWRLPWRNVFSVWN